MAIAELEKIRSKYPQYSDIDDVTLATNLSKKYPVYGDLVNKVRQEAEVKLSTTPQDIAQAEKERPGLEPGERSLIGDISERPGAAVRKGILSGLQGEGFLKGYKEGAILPENVPKFQELALQKYYEKAGASPLAEVGGLGVSAAGMAADVLTNPSDVLAMVVPQAPGIKQALSAIGQTKPLQALSRFGTKERSLGIPGRGVVRKYVEAGKTIKDTPAKISGLDADIAKLKESKYIGTDTQKGQMEIAKQVQRLNDKIKERARIIKDTGKDTLAEATGRASEEFQGSLKSIFKEAGNKYGKRFDRITSGVSKKGIQLLQNDASNAVSEAVKQSSDDLIDVPPALQKLAEKYSRDVVRDASGKIISAPKNISVEEVASDIKSLRNLMSGGFKRGEKSIADDLPFEYAANNLISVLNKATKGKYAKLQKSYSPVMKIKKDMSRIFKPYGGETATKGGASFLGRITKPGASLAEKKLYEATLKGGEFYKPIKDVTKEITPIRQAIQDELKKVLSRERRITEAEKNTIRSATKQINDQIASKKINISELEQAVKDAESFRSFVKRTGLYAGIGALSLSKVRSILTSVIGQIGD